MRNTKRISNAIAALVLTGGVLIACAHGAQPFYVEAPASVDTTCSAVCQMDVWAEGVDVTAVYVLPDDTDQRYIDVLFEMGFHSDPNDGCECLYGPAYKA